MAAATATDFAISGAVTGIRDFNSNPAVGLSDLAAQVTNFENEITAPVTNALYTVWAGANDALNLLESSDIATLVSSGAAATDMAQSASNEVAALQSLVADGATNLLVLNVPDIGKTPSVIAMGSADVATGTTLAQEFNSDLSSDLSAANFGTATVKLVDTFGLIDAAVADPTAYGLNPSGHLSSSVYTGSFKHLRYRRPGQQRPVDPGRLPVLRRPAPDLDRATGDRRAGGCLACVFRRRHARADAARRGGGGTAVRWRRR